MTTTRQRGLSTTTTTTAAVVLCALLALLPLKVAACPYLRRMMQAKTEEHHHSDHAQRRAQSSDEGCGGGDGHAFCYGTLAPSLPALELSWSTLVAIAEPAALAENFGYMEDSQARSNELDGFVLNNIAAKGAAGYTYLGQLLSHDVNLDETSTLGQAVDPATLPNTNTPSLDLDTLYNFDGCTPDLQSGKFIVNGRDFDRHGNGDAKICDPRNDEHRIVSQLTVAWMTLHNKFVSDLGYDFDDAREATIKEWQAVVLTDLLPTLLDEAVLAAVASGIRALYVGEIKDSQTMPVEFSTAAYRLFHSRARGRYRLNDDFDGSAGKPRARLFDVGNDELTLLGGSPLPVEMLIDWDRFFGDSTEPGSKVELSRITDMLYSRPIMRLPFNEAGTFDGSEILVECVDSAVDTCPIAVDVPVVCPFGTAPPCELKANLALLDLLRGQTHSLPGGIALAEYVKTLVPGLDVVSFADMTGNVFGLPDGLSASDIDVPLLLYLAHESIRDHDGQRLGALGSRVVAEVLFGLVETTEPSILDGDSDADGEAFTSLVTGGSVVTMVDVLDYIGWH